MAVPNTLSLWLFREVFPDSETHRSSLSFYPCPITLLSFLFYKAVSLSGIILLCLYLASSSSWALTQVEQGSSISLTHSHHLAF